MIEGLSSSPFSSSKVSIPTMQVAASVRYPDLNQRTSSPGARVMLGSLGGPVGQQLTPRGYPGSLTAPTVTSIPAYDLSMAARGKSFGTTNLSPAPSPTLAQRLVSMPTPAISSVSPPTPLSAVTAPDQLVRPVNTPLISTVVQPLLPQAPAGPVELVASPRTVELVATPRQTVGTPRQSRLLNQAATVVSTPARVLTASPDPAKASIRSTLEDQHATIKELERRLAQSTLQLAERESRIAELTRKNDRLQNIAQGLPLPSKPTPKAKGKSRRSPSPRSDSLERDRSSTYPGRGNRDELEDDEIDLAVRQYLSERPEVQIEMTKVRKSWYMVKPLGKKVFLKTAGKDKLIVRVGGGYVSFEKFIDDFTPGGEVAEITDGSRYAESNVAVIDTTPQTRG